MELSNALVAGLVVGGAYALLALGVSLIFSTTGVLTSGAGSHVRRGVRERDMSRLGVGSDPWSRPVAVADPSRTSTSVDFGGSSTYIDFVRTTFNQDPDGVLSELAAVREARHELERQEAALVRRARNEGIVWEQIAASLGVTKQAVHRKFGGRRLTRDKSSR